MRHSRSKQTRKLLKFLHLNFGIQAPYKVVVDGTFLAEAVTNNIPILERLVGMFREKVAGHGEQGYGNSTNTLSSTSSSSSSIPQQQQHRKSPIALLTTRSVINELKALVEANPQRFSAVLKLALDECEIIEEREYAANEGPPGKDDDEEENKKKRRKGGGATEPTSTKAQADTAPTSIYKFLTPTAESKRRQHFFICTQDPDLSQSLNRKGFVTCLRIHRTVLCMEGLTVATKVSGRCWGRKEQQLN